MSKVGTPQDRVKIHLYNAGYFDPKLKRIHICQMDGQVLRRCKKVRLSGNWIIRQYNNPVPCGQLTVLYPEDDSSGYEIVK